jgi:hypothetical protein
MGLTNAGLNFMYFIFILNIAIAIVGSVYPDFSYINLNEQPELQQTLEKIENINPDTPTPWGAYDVVKTLLSNIIGGNYHLWRALGVDETWAWALRVITYLSYIIVMISIAWGRLL